MNQLAPTNNDVFIERFSTEWPSVHPSQDIAVTLSEVEAKVPDILHRLHGFHDPLQVCWSLHIASAMVSEPPKSPPTPSPKDSRRLAHLANSLGEVWPRNSGQPGPAETIASILARAPAFLDALEAVNHPQRSLALIGFAKGILSL